MTVLRWTFLAVGAYAASLVPFLLMVEADHLTPAWLRRLPLTLAALLLILGGSSG